MGRDEFDLSDIASTDPVEIVSDDGEESFKFQTMDDAFAWAQERIGDARDMTTLQRNVVVSQLDRLYRTGMVCPDCGQFVWLPGSSCSCGALSRPVLSAGRSITAPPAAAVLTTLAALTVVARLAWGALRARRQ